MAVKRSDYLARQPGAVNAVLAKACVGIAGLGGLGSVAAENLARAGVGHLVLVDFDTVEASNLNRQRYDADQIGQLKTEALAANLKKAVPFVKLTVKQDRVTANQCQTLFHACQVVVECLDSPESKAAMIAGMVRDLPHIPVVAASGMAGLGKLSDIRIEKRMKHVYIVGDQQADTRAGMGVFASRAGVVASMQAHLVLSLLAGDIECN